MKATAHREQMAAMVEGGQSCGEDVAHCCDFVDLERNESRDESKLGDGRSQL